MNESVVLGRAIELIEQGWTQGWWARTEDGDPVSVLHDNAVSFCTRGALRRACIEAGDTEGRINVEKLIQEQLEGESIVRWNDHPERTAAQVKEVLRRARAEAEFRAGALSA